MSKKFFGHWDEVGEGFPVVCIAGFASSNWIFRRLIEPLAGKYHFILPDNRGMGASPPAKAPYGLGDLADDVSNLMADLGHARYGVIGLSMGGFVAQLLALRQPQRVASIVLMCTSSGGKGFQEIFPMLSREQVAAIYQLTARQRIEAALAPQFCPMLTSRYPATYTYVLQQRLAHEENSQQVMMQYDAVAEFMKQSLPLSTLTTPTLIMAGDHDFVVPLVNAQRLASAIPQAILQVFPQTDHLFFLEESEKVTESMGRFLFACRPN
ncbi:MAG: alpha/beta hydrolase [Magnetococcales bacterium]|nr:alpha/beta hydrolase [Magnetococcales bacterium]NGZ26359.1 alpha/beta hydrolase [Magnetococcales bacterium]